MTITLFRSAVRRNHLYQCKITSSAGAMRWVLGIPSNYRGLRNFQCCCAKAHKRASATHRKCKPLVCKCSQHAQPHNIQTSPMFPLSRTRSWSTQHDMCVRSTLSSILFIRVAFRGKFAIAVVLAATAKDRMREILASIEHIGATCASFACANRAAARPRCENSRALVGLAILAGANVRVGSRDTRSPSRSATKSSSLRTHAPSSGKGLPVINTMDYQC